MNEVEDVAFPRTLAPLLIVREPFDQTSFSTSELLPIVTVPCAYRFP